MNGITVFEFFRKLLEFDGESDTENLEEDQKKGTGNLILANEGQAQTWVHD